MSDRLLKQQPGGRDVVQESQGTVSGGGLAGKVGGPRNLAILAAGGTVALVALVTILRKGSSTPAPAAQQNAGAFDSSPYDMWNQWEQQYEDLSSRVDQLQNPPPTNPPPTKTPLPLPVPIDKPPLRPPAPKPPAPPSKPSAKPSTPPKQSKPASVTVKRGDTLSGIAKKYGISMATLKKLNPVYWRDKKYRNGDLIWAGDKVRLR